MKKSRFLILYFLVLTLSINAQQWPEVKPEAKAGARWWWLGSAVDKENLQWSMQQYANHGIGALEITPIYGVQGNQANNIPYLSDKWMEMLRFTEEQGKANGIEIDMATGTGWPFGGPWVPLEESACKAVFVDTFFIGSHVEALDISAPKKEAEFCRLSKVMAYYQGEAYDITDYVDRGCLSWSPEAMIRQQLQNTKNKTAQKALKLKLKELRNAKWRVVALYVRYGVMKVKRAAPGGEGLVIDHFDKTAVANYLQHIEAAFERTGTPYPHTFFNDSYEVSEATWTPSLLDEFEKRRGYKLQDYFLLLNEGDPRIVSDYRETLGDLLLENFTQQWTEWAHRHGAITRNQAHGSPANLIDCYAAVDIPEIEGFGLSEFGIKGLRQDPGKTRKNDSDFSMLKYAPSAAHICGKPYTSSETFTWLTEHFRTSLSQLKPDIDLMFCAGVNHMFFHGTCYSPKDDPWPGWKFYASIDMSSTNSIWRDAPYFMQYVERCQSFLQMGEPDNDFLVYLPVRDMWQQNTEKLLMQFSIHAMGKLAPEFIKSILDIDRAGFDCDYISEKYILSTTYKNGMLETVAGTRYKGLVIPGSGKMPENVKAHIRALQSQGAHIIYGTNAADLKSAARPEAMKSECGLKAIRRKNSTGYHYFIANLSSEDINDRLPLAVSFKDAVWFNPLNGNITPATFSGDSIDICLHSGESMILQTYNYCRTKQPKRHKTLCATNSKPLTGPWTLSFIDEAPKVNKTFKLDKPQTWEKLNDDSTRVTMGTGVYTTHINLSKKDISEQWQIDLGDVRESARVYINGQFIGCAWSVPFVLDCKNTLKAGDNEIRIEVTNLPANHIADYDRKGIKWRKMEEINVVDINYKRTTYDNWEAVPSGLNSEVSLIQAPDSPSATVLGITKVPLSAKEAQQYAESLIVEWKDSLRAALADKKDSPCELKIGKLTMPLHWDVYDDEPADGRSLFISLHGGGGAPKELNDGQWKNQWRLYRPAHSVYLCPRAPVDEWNMHFIDGIDEFYKRIIQMGIAYYNVNPNKVYVMGYSAGGDGVWRLAPRMADSWAAASMMAGHPGDVSLVNLRNTPFMIWCGAQDSAYNRNLECQKRIEEMQSLHQTDPMGYINEGHIVEGKGHWMDRVDTVAVSWMAQFKRNPYPEKIVWKQSEVLHPHFYWLSAPKNQLARDKEVCAEWLKNKNGKPANIIRITHCDYSALTISLNDQMIDFAKPVKIIYGDKVLFNGMVTRSAETLRQTLYERCDPCYMFPAQIRIEL